MCAGNPSGKQFTHDVGHPLKVVAWTAYISVREEDIEAHAPNCFIEWGYEKFDTGDSIATDLDHNISDADVGIFNFAVHEILNEVMPRTKRDDPLWVAFCDELVDMAEEPEKPQIVLCCTRFRS